MEDSSNAVSEEEKEVKTAPTEPDCRCSVSSSLEVPTSEQKNPSPPPVCIIDEQQPRQPTPPSATQPVPTDKEEKFKEEADESCDDMDIEVDEDDDVTIVPPPITTTTTPNPPVEKQDEKKPDAGEDTQPTNESRNSKEEQEPQSFLEIQRQRQRQALRGPTPSSPQVRSRKASPVVSKTGVKRDREEYEEGQVDEDEVEDRDGGKDEPGIILENKPKDSPVQDSSPTKKQALVPYTDADDNSDVEIVIMGQEKPKGDKPKEQQKDKKGSTPDGRQQVIVPQPRIKKKKIPITLPPNVKGPNPIALGNRSHYRDFINPPVSLTRLRSFVTTPQPSTTSLFPPSPQPRLQKKLGISHMDLLYKTERESMVCRICL
jgi:hypothetical protein